MSDVRRVSVYAGDAHVDLALPAGVPVGSLIPPILDIVAAQGPRPGAPVRYGLSSPGRAPLDPSKTLAQLNVRDGTLLVLSASPTPKPKPRFDDAADAVSTSLAAQSRPATPGAVRLAGALAAGWPAVLGAVVLVRTGSGTDDVGAAAGVLAGAGCIALAAAALAHRGFHDAVAGLTLGLLATGFAAAAGWLAVPGGPGAPNALLAATAAATTAVLALRITGCGTATFTATACVALVAVVAALAAVGGAVPLRAVGATCTVVSLGLIEVSARTAILLAGLSPRLAVQAGTDRSRYAPEFLPDNAIRADAWLTGLVAAFATSAALGAIGTLIAVWSSAGGPRVGGIAFATLTGTTLLARLRSHPDTARALLLVVAGTATLGVGFVAAASAGAGRPVWIAVATVVLTGAALSLGFAAPAVAWSPVARRCAELLDYAALAAVVPLACWIGGLYGAARGLSLS